MNKNNVFAAVGFDDAEAMLRENLNTAKSRADAVNKAGMRIQNELNRMNASEKSISQETGINRTHVRRLLAGNFKKFTLAQLVDIAQMLGMDVELKFKKPKSDTK